jgi:hypothetical protein
LSKLHLDETLKKEEKSLRTQNRACCTKLDRFLFKATLLAHRKKAILAPVKLTQNRYLVPKIATYFLQILLDYVRVIKATPHRGQGTILQTLG